MDTIKMFFKIFIEVIRNLPLLFNINKIESRSIEERKLDERKKFILDPFDPNARIVSNSNFTKMIKHQNVECMYAWFPFQWDNNERHFIEPIGVKFEDMYMNPHDYWFIVGDKKILTRASFESKLGEWVRKQT